MEAMEQALHNRLVVEKIVSFCTYEQLKKFRLVNKLWRDEITKVLKKKTKVVVSQKTIDSVLARNEVFSTSVQLNWGFRADRKVLDFFNLYADFVEHLYWKTFSGPVGDTFIKLWNHRLPKLKELVLESGNEFGPRLTDLLNSAPNLKNFRVEVNQMKVLTRDVIKHMWGAKMDNLTSLYFGTETFLTVSEFDSLIKLNLKLKHFCLTGRMFAFPDGCPISRLLNSWSETLETAIFRVVFPFHLKPMPKLTRFAGACFNILSPLPMVKQFPSLTEFDFNMDSEMDWNSFLPVDMPPHLTMRKLILSSDRNKPCMERILSKCPNLVYLETVADDDTLKLIFEKLGNLEWLSIKGSFTDEGITNIPKTLSIPQRSKSEEEIVSQLKMGTSIRKLTKLKELSVQNRIVGDSCVLFGISELQNLKTLYLPPGISYKSLQKLAEHPNLKELGIPSPNDCEGRIKIKDMIDLKKVLPHLRLRVGVGYSGI